MNASRSKGGWLVISAMLTLGLGVPGSGCAGGGFAGVIVDSSDFLNTGRTRSFFRAIQVDPPSEDSAGPQFVVAADLNGDGRMDLISAWNQSQPVQIHLQGRTATGAMSFETTTIAGSVPVVSVAGLAVADFDGDGVLDIAVLVKQALLDGPQCLSEERPAEGLAGVILIYFGPGDVNVMNRALAWEEVRVGNSFLQGTGEASASTEVGGFTSMAVGDMNNDGNPDIVAAWNSSCGEGGTQAAVLFTNQGAGPARDGTWSAAAIPDSLPKGTAIKSVALGDIDGDGDLDVVATFPDAPTGNVRWYRNPAMDVPDDYHFSDGNWQTGTIGHIATGADIARVADIDRDGLLDVVVRSSGGRVIQWFRGPEGATTAPLRALPWQVYTLAEYRERTPSAIALGDLTGNGRLEAVAAAEGGLSWFGAASATNPYNQWTETLIVDDAQGGGSAAATTDPNVAAEEIADTSIMNGIIVVDLDGDGRNDIVVTLDRNSLSGLTNDALVWFRNER